jgi:hypothetical protein
MDPSPLRPTPWRPCIGACVAISGDTLRYDAIEVASRALDHAVGGAIAALVMGGLARLRAELTQVMRALPWSSREGDEVGCEGE